MRIEPLLQRGCNLGREAQSRLGYVALDHFHALGRMLFAFTVFWAYTAFFQALLIRIANKPDEVTYYLSRVHGAWAVFVVLLILGHFAAPFEDGQERLAHVRVVQEFAVHQ